MDPRPVKIYSIENVPRLRYIAELILGDILGLSWEVISDKRKLGKNPVINYSDRYIAGSFKISPAKLLFETGVSAREITVTEWNELPVFFQTSSDSDLPFDIFAASFFLVSRYEEYLEHQSDEYGRFKASSSLAFRNGFLRIPVVDLWAKEFSKVFLKKFRTLTFKRNSFKSLLTIDVDQALPKMSKGLFSSIGELFRDISKNTSQAGERSRIASNGEKDPFEVFDYLEENIERINSEARFFFPVGDHSRFDHNPSWKNNDYRRLINRIADKYATGLHSSYFAAENSSMINNENTRLETILGKEITISQFHYKRFMMPQSYSYLNKTKVSEDYSMGYPEEQGFRAGIARPYDFYNIYDDQHTNLKIIPFQIMDWTMYKYKNLDADSSKAVISEMINETRRVGGTFVSIWHNTSLLDNNEQEDWRSIFEFMLKSQSQ